MTQAHVLSSPWKSRWIQAGVLVVLLLGVLGLIEDSAAPADAREVPAQPLAQPLADAHGIFMPYIAWLAEAHAHAARDGEDLLLPSQF